MKMILEMKEGVPFLYIENEKHFRKAEKHRVTYSEKIPIDFLATECNLLDYGTDFHIVADIKPIRRKRCLKSQKQK